MVAVSRILTLLCLPFRTQSYNTVPDAAELQISWAHNMHLGRAKNGNLIRLEAWGAVNVAEIQSSWVQNHRLQAAWLFLEELQNIALTELSYLEREVRQVVMLVDAKGMSTAHKFLAVYLREVSARDGSCCFFLLTNAR